MNACSAMMQAIVQLPKPWSPPCRELLRLRLPAGRKLRSGGGIRSGRLRDPRRRYRIVLLDPDGALSRNVPRKQAMERCC